MESIKDIQCPYCLEGQDICHDDGQGYAEDVTHEQNCLNCHLPFFFNTHIMYSYVNVDSEGHEIDLD